MKVGRKLKKPEKLNLVPILDSVFIFIFFLLMSAQFEEVFEIGSSLPMIKESKDEKQEKDPLNLTLEISRDKVVIKTGLRALQARSFASTQTDKMKAYLSELKRIHPKENTMILKTDPKVSFQELVTLIDKTQTGKNGKEKLFEQIVFDNSGVK